MDAAMYRVSHSDELITPVLLYYKDYIIQNIQKAVAIAGDPQRLWPHVKTHKTRELISLLIEHGVTRFKCATIAEAEVVASCGPTDIILAYPLVGPNVARFLALQQNFPNVRFWSIGDDLEQMRRVSDAAQAAGTTIRFMADVNVGQNRTAWPWTRSPRSTRKLPPWKDWLPTASTAMTGISISRTLRSAPVWLPRSWTRFWL